MAFCNIKLLILRVAELDRSGLLHISYFISITFVKQQMLKLKKKKKEKKKQFMDACLLILKLL